MKFLLDQDQVKIANDWIEEQMKNEYFRRKESGQLTDMDFELNGKYYPYHGAIGGAVEYSFQPTSLGVISVVKYLDKELNLTKYDEW